MSSLDRVIEQIDLISKEDKPKTKKVKERLRFKNESDEIIFNIFKEIISINIGVHGAENAVLVIQKYINTGYLDVFTSTRGSRDLASILNPNLIREILFTYYDSNSLEDVSRKFVYEEILDVKANILNMAALATYDKYCNLGQLDQLKVALFDFATKGDTRKFTNDVGCRDLLSENVKDYEAKVVLGYAAGIEEVYNYGINSKVVAAELVNDYVDTLRELKSEEKGRTRLAS